MMKRFLSALLSLAMILSMFTGLTFTASAEDSPEPGQYVIAANVNGTYYAMSNVFASKINGTIINVSNGKVSADDAGSYLITLEKDGDYYLIKNDSVYLTYSSSTNLGTSASVTDAAKWTLSNNNGAYLFTNVATDTRGLIFQAGTNNRFGGYAISNLNQSDYYGIELLTVASSGEHVCNNKYTPKDATHHTVQCQNNDGNCPFNNEPYDEECTFAGEVTTNPAATCTTDGTKYTSCVHCTNAVSETIPATGHDFSNNAEYCRNGCGTANPDYEPPVIAEGTWEKKALTEITATDEVVIVYNVADSFYAVQNIEATSSGPKVTEVTVANDRLSAAPTDDLIWNISNNEGVLHFYPNGITERWLNHYNSNNGIRCSDRSDNSPNFEIDNVSGYLRTVETYTNNGNTTNRYLGIYNATDLRCYTTPTTTNIKDQTVSFFVKTSDTPPEPPEPTDEIVVYVVNKTDLSDIKIYAWGDNVVFDGTFDDPAALELVPDVTPIADKEGNNPVECTLYKYTLNSNNYNGLLLKHGSAQTGDVILTEGHKAAGYVVVYFYYNDDNPNNGIGAGAIASEDAEIWVVGQVHPATCTKAAYTTYVGYLDPTHVYEVIPEDGTGLDHDYTITYTWALDCSTCEAKAVCSRDVSHTIVEEVNSTSDTTEEGTTYTATFPEHPNLFETQTQFVAIPEIGDTFFQKVESTEGIESGTYLIVYESSAQIGIAFNGGAENLNSNDNDITVTINNKKIPADATTLAAVFTLDVESGSLKASDDRYIGQTSYANGMVISETAIANSFSIDADGNAVISCAVGDQTVILRYNDSWSGFRYYKSDSSIQTPIALYKYVDNSHHHNVVHVQAEAPTCLDNGNVEYYYCDVEGCPLAGQYFSDEALTQELDSIVIPAAGHTPADAVEENRLEPTCTVAGHYDSVVKCSVCGAEISRETVEIPATGHDWGAWTVTTPATCTEAGEESRSCSKCGAVETRALDASGHSYGDYTYDEDHPGHHKRVCTACGEIELSRCTYVDGVCELCGHEFVVNDITVFAVAPDLNALNAYFWKTENGTDVAKSAWPGEAMTFLGLDTEGRSCFKFTVTNEYENLILNGNGGQYPGSGQGGLEYVFDAGENDYVIYNLSPWTKCDTAEDIYYVPDGAEEYVWAADNSTCTATLYDLATGTAITETVTANVEHIPAAIGVPGKDVFTADFENELFATQVKEVETEPALHLDDGYYLLIAKDDTQWDINFIDPNNKFEVYSRTAEWKLSTNLTVGDMIKVVKVVNDIITGWWADGPGMQYTVDTYHSGYVDIYFQLDYNSAWEEFKGYFYIPGHALTLPIGCTLDLEGATGLNYLINKNDLEALNLTDLKLVVIHTKYDKATGTYSDETVEARLISDSYDFQDQGTLYYEYRYENIPFSMLNDHMIARLEGKNSNGETVTTAWKEYNPMSYCNRIGTNSNNAKLRRVCANLILYAAEAQKRFGYNTEHLATENWNDALESVANRNDPELTATPSNTPLDGQKLMIKTMTLELEGRVELNLYVVKADEGSQTLEELIEGKKIVFTYENVHGQTSTVEIPSTQWVRSDKDGVERYRCNFSRLNAAEFRKTVTAVIMEGSEQAGNTVTCSVEAYAKIKYSDEVETAMIKAMMNYGDAAAAYFAK